jgi:molybdopterin-guanine dinucleotide biosynthesis protein A
MGTDKAIVHFDGQPLAARALSLLRELGLPGAIAGPRSTLGDFAPVVEDDGLGPLGGICAALASASADLVAFLPVDLPLLPASLVRYMLRHAQITAAAVTVASVNGYPQTFPAIVARSALPALETALHLGNRGCFEAFQTASKQMARPFSILPVELLVQAGQVAHPEGLPVPFWFLNVNRPADLVRGETVLAARRRVS